MTRPALTAVTAEDVAWRAPGADAARLALLVASAPSLSGYVLAGAPAALPDAGEAPLDMASLSPRARAACSRAGVETVADALVRPPAGGMATLRAVEGLALCQERALAARPEGEAAAAVSRAAGAGALLRADDAVALGDAAWEEAALALAWLALRRAPFGGAADEIARAARIPRADAEAALARLAGAGLARKDALTWSATGEDVAPALMEGASAASAAVLSAWIAGATLEEAGGAAGVTKQRAHQVASRACAPARVRMTSAWRAAPLVGRYDIPEAAWAELGLPALDRRVLGLAVANRMGRDERASRLPAREMARDPALPAAARRVAASWDAPAPPTRRELFAEACALVAPDAPAAAGEAGAAYARLLEGRGLDPADPALALGSRWFDPAAGHVPASYPVLFCPGRLVRRWDPVERDLAGLARALSRSRLSGREATAGKVLEVCARACAARGLARPEELHAALRRAPALAPGSGVSCGRYPMVRVGECDRARQVAALADEVEPAGMAALARAYEGAYGVPAATFMATAAYAQAAREWLESHGKGRA